MYWIKFLLLSVTHPIHSNCGSLSFHSQCLLVFYMQILFQICLSFLELACSPPPPFFFLLPFFLHRPPAYMLSHFSSVWLCVTPWTVACQALLSIGFSRQEYWSRLPCPPPGYLPDPWIELMSYSPALTGRFFTTSATWEAPIFHLSPPKSS